MMFLSRSKAGFVLFYNAIAVQGTYLMTGQKVYLSRLYCRFEGFLVSVVHIGNNAWLHYIVSGLVPFSLFVSTSFQICSGSDIACQYFFKLLMTCEFIYMYQHNRLLNWQ